MIQNRTMIALLGESQPMCLTKMCELKGVEKEFRQKMYIFGFCQVVSVITEGLPQVFGTNLVNGQVLQSFS